MGVVLTSVGAKIKYCWETTAGTRPTTGYTQLPDVDEAPAFDLSPNNIDVSNITDKVSKKSPGRQDVPDDAVFTLNHTEEVITAWDALVAQVATKKATGLQLWWEYWFEGATKSYFWAGYPQELGTSGIQQNAKDTIPAHVCPTDWAGWETASTTTNGGGTGSP